MSHSRTLDDLNEMLVLRTSWAAAVELWDGVESAVFGESSFVESSGDDDVSVCFLG